VGLEIAEKNNRVGGGREGGREGGRDHRQPKSNNNNSKCTSRANEERRTKGEEDKQESRDRQTDTEGKIIIVIHKKTSPRFHSRKNTQTTSII
jgi:hypothetical protein